MKKLTMVLAVLAVVAPYTVRAAEIVAEYRVTLVKGYGQPIQWRSGYAGAVDFGLPVDLGLALVPGGNVGSDSGMNTIDLYISLPIYTFYSADSSKSLKLETYVSSDLAQGTSAKSRTGVFGAIWDPGLKQNLCIGLRGALNNYDWFKEDGSKTSLTDFSVQTVLQIPVGVQK